MSNKLTQLNKTLTELQSEVGFVLHELSEGRRVKRAYLGQLLIQVMTQAENATENTVDGLIEQIAAANGLAPDDVAAMLEALAGMNSIGTRKRALRRLREVLPDILIDLEFDSAFDDEPQEVEE